MADCTQTCLPSVLHLSVSTYLLEDAGKPTGGEIVFVNHTGGSVSTSPSYKELKNLFLNGTASACREILNDGSVEAVKHEVLQQ